MTANQIYCFSALFLTFTFAKISFFGQEFFFGTALFFIAGLVSFFEGLPSGIHVRRLFNFYSSLYYLLGFSVIVALLTLGMFSPVSGYDVRLPLPTIISKSFKYSLFLLASLNLSLRAIADFALFSRCFVLFIASLAVAEVVGVVDFFARLFTSATVHSYLATFLSPFGFLRYNPLSDLHFTAGSIYLPRAASWCHEPKGLALFLTTLFLLKFLIFAFPSSRKLFPPYLSLYLRRTFLLTPLLIFFTGSGSGLLLFALVSAAISFLLFVSVSRLAATNPGIPAIFKIQDRLSLFLLFSLSAAIAVSVFLPDSSDTFLAPFQRRLGENPFAVTDDWFLSLDPEDAVLFVNLPKFTFFNWVFGLGAAGFSRFTLSIPENFYFFGDYLSSPFARNFLIEVFFDTGLIGLVIVIFLFFKSTGNLLRRSLSLLCLGYPNPLILFHSVVTIIFCFFLRSDDMLFFWGLTFWIVSVLTLANSPDPTIPCPGNTILSRDNSKRS